MSLITQAIPPQAFELIRDRIGEILTTEINKQYTLTYDEELDIDAVWVERFIPFDKEEMPAINVTLISGNLSGHTQRNTDGQYTYAIDVYTKAKSRDDDPGDALATRRLHRLIGICRAILESPYYPTLAFTPPFIANRHCESISIAEPGRQDAVSAIMGRLTFVVRVPESMELKTPTSIAFSNTSVKINTTDKGYFYAAYA
jgi:hypothetical protein